MNSPDVYPHHEHLSQVRADTQAVHDFLGHAAEYGVHLCTRADEHHQPPREDSFGTLWERWRQIDPDSVAAAREFLAWARKTSGAHLDREHYQHRIEFTGPGGDRFDQMLAAWKNIDLDAIEAEKRAMLAALRSQNNAEG